MDAQRNSAKPSDGGDTGALIVRKKFSGSVPTNWKLCLFVCFPRRRVPPRAGGRRRTAAFLPCRFGAGSEGGGTYLPSSSYSWYSSVNLVQVVEAMITRVRTPRRCVPRRYFRSVWRRVRAARNRVVAAPRFRSEFWTKTQERLPRPPAL